MELLKTSKVQMALFLFFIAASTILFEKRLQPFPMIVTAVLGAVAVDMLFIKLRKEKLFFPSAAIVSGLIIGLLFNPFLPWYNLVLTIVIAIASKNFLRYKNRHVFNPAAFGLFVTGLLLDSSISWWAVSFQSLHVDLVSIFLFLVLLSPGYVSILRMRRYKILVSFFVAYSLLLGSLQLFQIQTLLDPTTIFFGLVMLTEPMTSPNKPKIQLLFGTFVAIVVISISFVHFTFSLDPLITSLLIGNLVFFRFR